MIEIERKFLVNSGVYMQEAVNEILIKQGYLNSTSARTVRVRIGGNQGFITVKGESSSSGLSRFEWEQEISKEDAEGLLSLCEPGIIEKVRYEVPVGDHLYEVDRFLGENEGLILAEIELDSETESYDKPVWLGEEVTGNSKYYNSFLSKNPFKLWKQEK